MKMMKHMRFLLRVKRDSPFFRLLRIAWSISIFILIGLATSGCKRVKKGQIEIGALLPLTGSGANYGEYAKNGIELAVYEINHAGGVKGQNLVVLYEDSQSNPSTGVSGFRKLLDVNKVPATLIEFSPVVMACAPIANDNKSVLLNCGAQTPKVREAGPFVFSAIPDANQEAVQMADFAYGQLGLREVSTFCINTETGIATTEIFVKHFNKLGGKIIVKKRHDQGGGDYRPQLTSLKAMMPPGIYMISLTRESALILKQASEIGLKTQWLSYTSFQGIDILTVAKNAAEGAIYTYPKFEPSLSRKAADFESAYKRRYSKAPEVYAATFYDGTYALRAAMEKVGLLGEDVQQGLRTIVYQGIAGPIDFRKSTWVDKPLQFRTVRDGQFVAFQISAVH